MKKFAFTLAEVLITLTIIGVIAALTIPNLMQKWQDHADVQKVKEAYSILSNAYSLCLKESGPPEEWDLSAGTQVALANCMRPYLKINKYCNKVKGCTPPIDLYQTLTGYSGWGTWTNNGYQNAILSNGMVLTIRAGSLDSSGGLSGSSNESEIRIDINGAKGPNRYGYDVFFFHIIKDRMTYHSRGHWSAHCNLTDTTTHYNGLSCSAWVLLHGNMDYKYRDVSKEW